MKKTFKIGSLIVIILVSIVAYYGYYEYTRKPADLSSVASAAQITADSLVQLFVQDEEQANSLYLGKAIDISGVISTMNQTDTTVNILFGQPDDMHRVSCLIDAKYVGKLKRYKPGDSIVLRGMCTGFLIDVELNRCVVIR